METWRRKRIAVGNIRHARRKASASTAEITPEGAKEGEEEEAAPTSIKEAHEDVVASVARFTTQPVLRTPTAINRTGRGKGWDGVGQDSARLCLLPFVSCYSSC